MGSVRFPAALALTAAVALTAARAAEPAGDPKLPVRDGLELWLDAARAAAEPGKPADNLPTWTDRSGHARHLHRPDPAARPALVRVGWATSR
jgi:hypothetical protein